MTKNREKNVATDDDRASNGNEPFVAIDLALIAIHSANIGLWIIDTATKKFLPSTRTKELFGYLPEEEMSLEEAMLQIVKKHRRAVLEAMASALKQRINLYIECPVVGYHDHQQRWLNVTGGFSDLFDLLLFVFRNKRLQL
ncbi:hypothetical protein [Mucilaginibacter sp.]|uniref:hypothetical protein n=1 Tax=Mucilaginibacter sp. TaxID=1882438 RepID=UPI003264C1D8